MLDLKFQKLERRRTSDESFYRIFYGFHWNFRQFILFHWITLPLGAFLGWFFHKIQEALRINKAIPANLNKLAIKFLNMILGERFGKITFDFGKRVRFQYISFIHGRAYHKNGNLFCQGPLDFFEFV